MLSFYQHLPESINPVAFSIGSFDIRWYSIMYLVGFFAAYRLLIYRAKSGENSAVMSNYQFPMPNQIQKSKSKFLKFSHWKLFGNWKLEIGNSSEDFKKKYQKELIVDFLLYSFAGLLIGARLGYVLFYNFSYFIHNLLAIVSPFDPNGNFIGIYGMSYFGGLIGIIIASVIFCRVKRLDFWKWADFVIPAVPAGYFFGRIGNFMNGELYGKMTDNPWGMYFGDEILRQPTQLYEALLEGLLLFIILWFLRSKVKTPGTIFILYIAGYGAIRFFVEFLREQEGELVLGTTRGQILSLAAIAASLVFFFIQKLKCQVPNPNVK